MEFPLFQDQILSQAKLLSFLDKTSNSGIKILPEAVTSSLPTPRWLLCTRKDDREEKHKRK